VIFGVNKPQVVLFNDIRIGDDHHSIFVDCHLEILVLSGRTLDLIK